MKKIVFIIGIILYANIIYAQKPIEDQSKISWMQGTWAGTGYQIDGNTWPVEMQHIGKRITIAYPSLGCSGWWQIVSINHSNIEFVEHITVNNGCDQGGKIIVSHVDEHNISIAWFLPHLFGNKAIAYTVLHKK